MVLSVRVSKWEVIARRSKPEGLKLAEAHLCLVTFGHEKLTVAVDGRQRIIVL